MVRVDEDFLYQRVFPTWEYSNVLDRILTALPDNLDKSQGSFHFDVASSMALEFERAASELMVEMLRRSFAYYGYGEWLDMRAEEHGIYRRSGIAARGFITFEGTPDTLIPAGTVVTTIAEEEDGPTIDFRTVENAVIPSSGVVDVPIVAIEAGQISNLPAGFVTVLRNLPEDEEIQGITAVYNKAPTTGGLDIEDDDTLRTRLLESTKRRDGYGNVNDYIAWAKEISGVGNVLVQPLWQGPGTVRVIVMDKAGGIPDSMIVKSLQDYLDPGQRGIGEGKAPIGHRVTVQGPNRRVINVTIPQLAAESEYTLAQVRDNIRESLRRIFVEASPGSTLRLKDVEAGIVQTRGVLDIGDVLLNGIRSNVVLKVDEKADVGEVIFT